MVLVSVSRSLALAALAVLLGLASYSEAEAQSRGGRDGQYRGGRGGGGGGGGSAVGTGLIIQGVIGIMAAQQEEEERKRRRPRPGKQTDEKKSKPRCGVPGRPTCPDRTADQKKPTCGVRGRPACPGKTAGTPSGGGRIPPIVLIPPPGGGDSGPPPRASGKREERAPPVQAGTADLSVARQVLVLVAANQPGTAEGQIASTHRLRLVSSMDVPLLEARAQVYRIDDRRSVQTVITALTSDPRVMLVQPNMIYQRQAGAGAARAAQYALDMVGAESAHELATGRGVKIAVIDSGIDRTHSDLKGAVSEVFDATDGKDAKPDVHGTAIAGIIRARGLVTGIAPDANLLAVRAFFAVPKRDLPQSTSFIVLRALDWSVQHGAQIVNLSFSGGRDPVIERAVAAIARRKVLLVAAAGNGGPEASPSYPAAYPDVIAVTALDSARRLYTHANHGSYITFAAPGVDILVPGLKNGHMFMSGTSMAAAYVSGIMALLLEKEPRLEPEEVLRALAETAEDMGVRGPDDEFGVGRVHARAALEALTGQAKAVGARQ
jgi:subtilisin family serine protease